MKLTVELMVSVTDDLVILHEGLVAVVPAADAQKFTKALRVLQAQAKDQVAKNILAQRHHEQQANGQHGPREPAPAPTLTRPRQKRPLVRQGSNEETILRAAAELPEPFSVGALRERLGEERANKNLHAVLHALTKKQLLDREGDEASGLRYRFSTKGTELMVGATH